MHCAIYIRLCSTWTSCSTSLYNVNFFLVRFSTVWIFVLVMNKERILPYTIVWVVYGYYNTFDVFTFHSGAMGSCIQQSNYIIRIYFSFDNSVFFSVVHCDHTASNLLSFVMIMKGNVLASPDGHDQPFIEFIPNSMLYTSSPEIGLCRDLICMS